MTTHTAHRIKGRDGTTVVAYEYRNTIIDRDGRTYYITGFGPGHTTTHPTLTAAKAYVDQVVDGTTEAPTTTEERTS